MKIFKREATVIPGATFIPESRVLLNYRSRVILKRLRSFEAIVNFLQVPIIEQI